VSRPRAAAVERRALGLAIDQLVAWGVLSYAYGVLVVPLGAEIGLTIETVAAGASVSLLVSAVLARTVGRASDRGRARAVRIAGAATGGLALLLLSSAADLWTLAAACVLLGIAQALSLYEVAFAVVVAEVVEPRARARALVVITTVAGLASTVFVPLTSRVRKNAKRSSGHPAPCPCPCPCPCPPVPDQACNARPMLTSMETMRSSRSRAG
jgi:MFS family permease